MSKFMSKNGKTNGISNEIKSKEEAKRIDEKMCTIKKVDNGK